MKPILIGLMLIGLWLSSAACATAPERIVQEQVRAYNARDLDWFVGLYSEDAAIHKLLSGEIVGQGRAYFLDRYANRFTVSTDLHATIRDRIVFGRYVIDYEEVVRKKSEPKVSALAIYSVDRDKIDNVWFIFDEDVAMGAAAVTRQAMARHEDSILRRDMAEYEATFTPDARTMNFPGGEVLAGNRDEIVAEVRPFLEGNQQVERKVARQIVYGNVVVNHELQRSKGGGAWTARVVIYEFADSRIRRCWILSNPDERLANRNGAPKDR